MIDLKPIEGWEYVFMDNGALGVGKVVRAGGEYSTLEWEITTPSGEKIKKSAVIWNRNLMNSITDLDRVIQKIKDSFDDNYVCTDEENKAFSEYLKKARKGD